MTAPYAALALVLYEDRVTFKTLTVLSVSRPFEPDDLGLPGGLVDPGETGVEAALRELREETGLIARAAQRVFSARNAEGKLVETYVVSKIDPRSSYGPREPGIAVGRVHPSRLLEPSCRYRDYHRALFRVLGWLR